MAFVGFFTTRFVIIKSHVICECLFTDLLIMSWDLRLRYRGRFICIRFNGKSRVKSLNFGRKVEGFQY